MDGKKWKIEFENYFKDEFLQLAFDTPHCPMTTKKGFMSYVLEKFHWVFFPKNITRPPSMVIENF
jgi:hypothetical protein